MTDEGIMLEYEFWLMEQGEPLKTCPKCGQKTHRQGCMTCTTSDGKSLQLSGDQLMDDVVARMAEGEDLDLNEIFKSKREAFVPVPRGSKR